MSFVNHTLKKQFFFSVVFCFLFATAFAQPQFITYYKNINNAESNLLRQKFKSADSCFVIAFNLDSVKGFNQDYLVAAINAYLLNDTALLTHYLQSFAMRGGDYNMLKNTFSSNLLLQKFAGKILAFIKLPKNKALKKQMQTAFKNYKQTLNSTISKKVNRIYFSDQVIARGITGFLPHRMENDAMEKLDRKNAQKLITLCQTYGWPGFNVIGEFKPYGKYSLSKANILIRHFTPYELTKIAPYVLASIKQANASPYDWAGALDYAAIKNATYIDSLKSYEMKQVYGCLGDRSNQANQLIPYGTLDEVEKARASLYLINIYDYSRLSNFKLPEKEIALIPKTN